MHHTIFKYTHIKPENIQYSKPIDGSFVSPQEYKKGHHIIYLSYEDKPILIQLPSLILTNRYDNEIHELLLPLRTKNNTEDKEIHTFFSELDKHILTAVSKILKSLKIKLNSLSYTAILKMVEGGDESYKNGALELKILPLTKLYNQHSDLVSVENYKNHLTHNCYIKSIIELSAIYVSHEKITVDIKLHQMKVSFNIPKPVVLTHYAFENTDRSDDEIDDFNGSNKISKKHGLASHDSSESLDENLNEFDSDLE